MSEQQLEAIFDMANSSTSNSSDSSKSHIDFNVQKFELTFSFILFALTIIGNAAVILILLLFKNKRKSSVNLRTVSRMSFYIINLSIADLSVAFLSILPQTIWKMTVYFFVNSNLLCKFFSFTQIFTVYASTFMLIVMAYDRFTCICRPMASCTWTYNRAMIDIAIAWVCAALIASPQAFLFSMSKVKIHYANITVETCYVKWSSSYYEKGYVLYHVCTQFLIPLALLSFFYIKIFLTVSKNISHKNASQKFDGDSKSNATTSTQMTRLSVTANANTIADEETSAPMLPKKKLNSTKMIPMRQNWSAKTLSKSKIKTLKLTLTVVIAYILCSVPFYSMLLTHVIIQSENYSQTHSQFMRKTFVFSIWRISLIVFA
jgi:hypothetical protein